MIKNIILFLLFSLLCNCIVAQERYLEVQKGIKKIETYKYTGNKARVKKIDHTKYFTPDGKLQKMENAWVTYEYYHEADKVVEVQTEKNADNCTSAHEYHITRDSNKVIIKKKIHKGKYAPKVPCENYEPEPEMGRVKADSLFMGLERKVKADPSVSSIFIYDYKNPESYKEYAYYVYSKTRSPGVYNLRYIRTVESDGATGYLHRNYFVSSYAKKNIHLNGQQIKDEYGFQLKYLNDRALIQPTGEVFDKWKYEFDEKKNWIRQEVILPEVTRVTKERVIEYY